MKPAEPQDRSSREWLAVAVVTVIGAGLRVWPIGRLGLTHFDEGIYALTASWVFQPKGLAALDPTLISYSPPGYTILAGLAYAVLGASDGAMIFVSAMAGTLTIPVVAWLGRRTFGPGAGFAAATFCSFSGPHIAFSRMALTDASSLLTWLIALGVGMQFLERPGPIRAIALGLTVGLAQQFKYNGWLTGGIVIGTAVLGVIGRTDERRSGPIWKTFGWGGIAAVLAWLVVWPWYRFVEGHGGYSALLRHQQSYLGGFGSWWPHFQVQADQAVALSGGGGLILAGLFLASLAPWFARPSSRIAESAGSSRTGRVLNAFSYGFLAWIFVDAPYWLGLVVAPWLLTRPRPAIRLVGVWWLLLSVMTPFYHPYARLWLPFHAINWLLMGWLVVDWFAAIISANTDLSGSRSGSRRRSRAIVLLGLFGCGAVVHLSTTIGRKAHPLAGLFAPSDSLRRACLKVDSLLPKDLEGLRVLVRPPVTYYLAGRAALHPMSGLEQAEKPGDPRFWTLIDSAIVRSELGQPSPGPARNLLDRFANHWELVEEVPTTLSLPTLLDLDPGAARRASADRSAPLWLLRPRSPRTSR